MLNLDNVFYLRKNLHARHIPLLPAVDDEGKFYAFYLAGEEIKSFTVINTVVGDYFAKKPFNEDKDVFFPFMNFMYQKASIPLLKPIFFKLNCVRSDLHNLSTSLKKLEVFHQIRSDKSLYVTHFATTEIEYIFIVCRSLFDLFQGIAKLLWSNINLVDTTIEKKELLDTFSKMVLRDNKVKTYEELKIYGLPDNWINFYIQEADFFLKLRNFRNNIIHHGHTLPTFFIDDKGFAVKSDYEPFAVFNVWNKSTFLPNDLAPIKPIVAFVINESIGVMSKFVEMFSKSFVFPEEIAPGYFLFMSGPHIHKLAELPDYINKDVWYT
jgi:hypothetical protein